LRQPDRGCVKGCATAFSPIYELSISKEYPMVKANLVSMSVEALLQLHDDIGNLLSQKASQLQNQLAALGDGGLAAAAANSGGRRRTSKMKSRKVAPKYRNPKNRSETWAGRGRMPLWLAAEIKKGRKLEAFGI
jgi:DNA-binding protein H-NS